MADYVGITIADPGLAVGLDTGQVVVSVLSGGSSGAPTVSNVTPPSGSRLTNKYAPVQFDVTDVDGLASVFISVPMAGKREVIYLSSEFSANYFGSSITAITDGFRFVIVRAGGWTEAPLIRVDAIDTGGNVA